MVSVDGDIKFIIIANMVCMAPNASSHTLSIVSNTGIAVTAASITRPIFMVDCPR